MLQLGLALFGRSGRQFRLRNVDGLRPRDHLLRNPVAILFNVGTKRLVPRQECLHSPPQSAHVQQRADTDCERDVVEITARRKALEKPQSLLCKRQSGGFVLDRRWGHLPVPVFRLHACYPWKAHTRQEIAVWDSDPSLRLTSIAVARPAICSGERSEW